MFLVDTNIISAAAPSRRTPPELWRWMDRRSAELFISAVTAAEIEDGVAKARRQGARAKARDLEAWFEALLHLYGERVLPFDTPVARVCGRLSDMTRAAGRPPGLADLIIAATAAHHGFTLLTRNTRHFAELGVRYADPYSALPD
jgi:predicted nucleic acid-binding protein